MQGMSARKQPKDQDEVLIQELKLRENSLKAVLVSVRDPYILNAR
jgi:hypothetical protein